MESYYSYPLPQSYLNSVPFETAYDMYPYDGNVPSSTASLPTSTSPPPAALASPINQYFAHDIPVTPPMDHWSGSESSGSSSPRTFESKIANEPMMKMTSTSTPPHTSEADAANRRRAQNRAAQRAFRARKEKHAKELEQQLHNLQEKYQSLQTSHSQLSVAYTKLRESVEVLTSAATTSPTTTASTIPPSGQTPIMNGGGVGNPELLRNLLNILYGEVKVEPGLEQF